MKKQWVGNRRKRFHGETWENAVRGGRACENAMRLSIYDGPIEILKYMWVNIWCMLDWVIGLAEMHFLDI